MHDGESSKVFRAVTAGDPASWALAKLAQAHPELDVRLLYRELMTGRSGYRLYRGDESVGGRERRDGGPPAPGRTIYPALTGVHSGPAGGPVPDPNPPANTAGTLDWLGGHGRSSRPPTPTHSGTASEGTPVDKPSLGGTTNGTPTWDPGRGAEEELMIVAQMRDGDG